MKNINFKNHKISRWFLNTAHMVPQACLRCLRLFSCLRKMMTIIWKLPFKLQITNEKQKRVKDRRMYETIILKITNHYKNKLQEYCVSPLSQQSQPAQLAQQLPISIELIGQCKLCKIMFLTRPCIPSPLMRLLLLTGFMMKQLRIWTHWRRKFASWGRRCPSWCYLTTGTTSQYLIVLFVPHMTISPMPPRMMIHRSKLPLLLPELCQVQIKPWQKVQVLPQLWCPSWRPNIPSQSTRGRRAYSQWGDYQLHCP